MNISQSGDEAAVDANVGAGEAGRVIAGEAHDEVGDFLWCGEAPGGRSGGDGGDEFVGGVAAGGGELGGDTVLSSHRSVETGPGLTVFTRMPLGPNSFEILFAKLAGAALVAL